MLDYRLDTLLCTSNASIRSPCDVTREPHPTRKNIAISEEALKELRKEACF